MKKWTYRIIDPSQTFKDQKETRHFLDSNGNQILPDDWYSDGVKKLWLLGDTFYKNFFRIGGRDLQKAILQFPERMVLFENLVTENKITPRFKHHGLPELVVLFSVIDYFRNIQKDLSKEYAVHLDLCVLGLIAVDNAVFCLKTQDIETLTYAMYAQEIFSTYATEIGFLLTIKTEEQEKRRRGGSKKIYTKQWEIFEKIYDKGISNEQRRTDILKEFKAVCDAEGLLTPDPRQIDRWWRKKSQQVL